MGLKSRMSLFKLDVKGNITKFISYFAICMIVFFSIMYIVEHNDIKTKRFVLRESEKNIVDMQKKMIEASLYGIVSDMMYIKESWIMQEFLLDSMKREGIEHQLLAFSKEKGIYDQLRFIDNDGNEIVRINYNEGRPSIVPISKLQNKADRYYFEYSIALDESDFYVSPLDLNIENGEIEEPIKPMIRFAVPAFDLNGQKRGVVILNYIAQNVIDGYEGTISRSGGRAFWLDENGYWIVSDEKEKQWAFMYEDGKQVSFANEFEKEWNSIKEDESGQFYTERGLFTFDTVHVHGKGMDLDATEKDDRHWKIVSYVPASTAFYATESEFMATMGQISDKKTVLGIISAVALLIVFLYMQNRLAEEEIRIHATYDGLTGVYNRGSGMKLLTEKIRESKIREEPLSVCFVDINGLKSVNDILGHEKGDELIRTSADVFSSNIRSLDFVARWGGDEFLIVFPNSKAEEAEKVWARIYNEIENINASEGRDYVISASHGVEEFSTRDSYEVDVLVKSADEKMYEEKARIKRNLEVIRKRPEADIGSEAPKEMA
ncbi:diguanylate cyclase (GGDEF) domain-containing protein [Peptoclostridium litorale DSM 5388]|uniref:GGDEF domain-containing protein n=1 Tax=Peptoclostridium litorale DSM 5388 TaxID=1121324 RepID=A0A069RCZ5_PEPLI|nr:diguanylate cyclase [Peptoclostridium litorale]KDR94613.1 hypothetical protein CLIT_14c00740 [Peptoclostridium litorale DSM 5388]SIO32144.1 diguanylate cyclase (GGDEF) domain-containing protein [Peptoclostridium litorale DSM 5388]